MGDLVVDYSGNLFGLGATATFSPCRTWRYALTRTWNPDLAATVWIMLNPSTADAFQLDPTIRRCVAFAKQWNTGGVVVLNLFGLRSTQPAALRAVDDPVGPDNDDMIAREAVGGRVVCAWGVHGRLYSRDRRVAALLHNNGVQPWCLGTTKDGQPKHPLYVPGDTQPVEYSRLPVGEVA